MPTGYIYAFLIGYTFAIGWLNVFVGFSDSKTKAYLYFGLVSLFASIFLLAQLATFNYSEFPGLTDTITIVSACSFYGLFLWFIGEYTGFKRRLIQIYICILLGIVLITFFMSRSSSSLETAWENSCSPHYFIHSHLWNYRGPANEGSFQQKLETNICDADGNSLRAKFNWWCRVCI